MIAFINSWAQGIIIAVIIGTIIEMILPEGNNKKYIKTIMGIYIIFVMINPLISKIGNKNINVENIIKNTTSKMEMIETKSNIAIETSSYVEETYKQKIEDDITKNANNKGYIVSYLNLNIETENEEQYGNINSIEMKINKKENNLESIEKNSVENIKNIQIEVIKSNNEGIEDSNKNENISEEEIKTFKNYLSNVYGIPEDRIYINK